MKTLAEELMAIGLAGIQQIPTDQPPLSEEDVDRMHRIAEQDEILSEGRQHRLPFRINPHGE